MICVQIRQFMIKYGGLSGQRTSPAGEDFDSIAQGDERKAAVKQAIGRFVAERRR